MEQHSSFFIRTFFVVGLIGLLGFVGQWFNLNWGRLELGQSSTITVTGQADDIQANQIATFSAGITVSDLNREAAVAAANTQIASLIDQVKAFGIPPADIKTENLSVYEYNEQPGEVVPMTIEPAYYPAPPVVAGQKKWQATNIITITLRDLSRATELASLLTSPGVDATVSGPNFTTDDTTDLDRTLLQEAMQDAREKADLMLEGTGQTVTRIVNVYENDYSTPYLYKDAIGATGGDVAITPVEPGSQTVYKSVSVVFEISR